VVVSVEEPWAPADAWAYPARSVPDAVMEEKALLVAAILAE
jgi:hypothetical protein